MTPLQRKHIKKVCGKFLYNGRYVDSTQSHAFNKLSIKATIATEETQEAFTQFLNYCASNPNTTIIYRASYMILSCNCDAAYLVAPKSRSQAGEYHHLGNKDGTQFNGPVYVLAKAINAVMGSAAEAKAGGLYIKRTRTITNENNIRRVRPPTITSTNTNR